MASKRSVPVLRGFRAAAVASPEPRLRAVAAPVASGVSVLVA